MLDRFLRHLAETNLIPPGARVLLGYSGGADSTCLLHLLKLANVDVVAGHLHHGQRSEADKEMALCEAFAQSIDVPFIGGRADIPRIAADFKIGLEEAGRNARYTFFRQAAHQLNCQLIATAHTLDDQAETILLNLTRGTGISGLAGIPRTRENIIRPLLPFSREETRQYCLENGFWLHDDPANVDISFSRARIRHRVLPELRSINPAADQAIARLGALADEENRFLNGMAAAALEQCEVPLNGALRFLSMDQEAAFDRAMLSTLPPVPFRRAVRLAVEAVGGSLSNDQTRIVESGVASDEKGSVTAEGGTVVVEWTPELVHVRQVVQAETFRFPITLPGETISDVFGWKFTAYEDPYSGARPIRASLEVELDRSAIKGPLYFRAGEQGDTMIPLGFKGKRKLSTLLSDAKLTLAARRRLPIVCDLVGPLWAPGVCLDERVRPGPSGRVVKLKFESYAA
jgi:tRNA(Ile)-lysidine synthase